MGSKQVVLAIFESEFAADDAAAALKSWDDATDDIKLGAVGILALDSTGQLKDEKIGKRSTGKGAGIGIVLAMLTPVGLAAGIIGGGVLGALHHKGLGLSGEDRERIGRELAGGKAAVGVLAAPTEVAAISAKLAELGGAAETYELDDAAVAEVDAAAEEAAPVAVAGAPTA